MTSVAKSTIAPDVSLLVDGQTADAGDVTAAIEDLRDYLRSGRVAITANDANVKHLQDAIALGTGLSEAVTNAAADEALTISLDSKLVNLLALLPASGKIQAAAVDSEASTSGYVLTANGSGGASFAAAGGGGAQPVDINGTAGEALAERDMVYLDESAGTWFKLDTDATGAVKVGRVRGCVNESGGISSAGTGSIRILGEVSGFTGLTAWAPVYASTTAGGYTQTRPDPSAGGGQVVVAEMGYAVSSSAILINPMPVEFIKRESLANDGTLTIEHYSDAQARGRNALAFVSSTAAGATLATYADSNQDASSSLRESSAAGGTTTITASGTFAFIGDSSGTEYWSGQTFQVAAGKLTQFTYTLGANSGTPTGTLTWEICADGGTAPGTVLKTGTHTPTASAVNTVTVTDGPRLAASTTYWLVLKPTTDQSSGNRWNWTYSASSTYANGVLYFSTNAGSSWTTGGDATCSITTAAVVEKDKIAQGFQLAAGATVDMARLYLRKVGSPTGTMTLRIETDSAGSPSGTLADANATVTVAESGLGTSYALVDFDFGTDFSLSGSTQYWLVLSTDRTASATNYVQWGIDSSTPGYADGEAKYESSSTWTAESADAVFTVLGPATTFDEPCVIGRWSAGTRDVAVRFDDGAAADGNIKTTFKNVTGGTLDMTCVVELG